VNGTFSGSQGVVGSMEGIELATVFSATNDYGVGRIGSKSVNVGTANDLGDITILELS
jgi:hypothetical protein